MVTPKISFREVFFSLKFLYAKILSTKRFDPKHIKLHFPGLRAYSYHKTMCLVPQSPYIIFLNNIHVTVKYVLHIVICIIA